MLPQVVVLIAGVSIIGPLVRRIGLDRAAWLSAAAIVVGIAMYTALSQFGYAIIAIVLVLVAAGMRVVGVVAGTNVLREAGAGDEVCLLRRLSHAGRRPP